MKKFVDDFCTYIITIITISIIIRIIDINSYHFVNLTVT
jgi:hypothetical protein